MTKNKLYPVVLFVYKRPASTRQLLNLIVQSGTCKLYIFADGPKNDSDREITHQVRQIIKDYVSQHTEIRFELHFSRRNQGLKKSIVAGLNHVFAHEQAAIILEDDCIPSPSFFRFMQEMLSKYKSVSKVMSINGTCNGGSFPHSYDFTVYPQCWGWSTWKRSWRLYNSKINLYDSKSLKKFLANLGFSKSMILYWLGFSHLVDQGQISSWAYRWSILHFYYGALVIVPSVNLVQNIGFDKNATNTKIRNHNLSIKTEELEWPLKHPIKIMNNISVSSIINKKFYQSPIAILGLIRQYIYWIIHKYGYWN